MLAASRQIPFDNSGLRRLQFCGPSLYDFGKESVYLFANAFESGLRCLRVDHDHEIQTLIKEIRPSFDCGSESSLETVPTWLGPDLLGYRNSDESRARVSDDPCEITFYSLSEAEYRFESLFVGSVGMNVMRKSWRVLDCGVASGRFDRRSCAYGREIRASYCVFGYLVGMCAS